MYIFICYTWILCHVLEELRTLEDSIVWMGSGNQTSVVTEEVYHTWCLEWHSCRRKEWQCLEDMSLCLLSLFLGLSWHLCLWFAPVNWRGRVPNISNREPFLHQYSVSKFVSLKGTPGFLQSHVWRPDFQWIYYCYLSLL